MLLAPRVYAEKEASSASGPTPWPRVLPCQEFSTLRFEVLVPLGATNWGFDDRLKEVVWKTTTGSSLRFRGKFGLTDLAAERIAVDKTFPIRQLSAIAVAGSSTLPPLSIWLACGGEGGNGIKWTCDAGGACSIAVVYGKESAYSWPLPHESVDLSDRLPSSPKPGPLGKKARAELLGLVRKLAADAVSWLDTACRDGRCVEAILVERSRLDRFVHAASTRVIRSDQKMERHNEHYPAGYPVFALTAEAGGTQVAVQYDELGWKLSIGRLTCDSGCLLDEGKGSLGEPVRERGFMHVIPLDSFVIEGHALAMDPSVSR